MEKIDLHKKDILEQALYRLEELLNSEDDNTKLKAIEIVLKYLGSTFRVDVIDEVREGEGE